MNLSNISFAQFIDELNKKEETFKHKNYVEANLFNNDYDQFYNFKLNTTTWRMFVNKQILMRYERLFIEKQMNEVKSKKTEYERQL